VAHWREMIGDSTKIVRPRQLYIGRTIQEIGEELETRSSRFLL
jgi:citrate synthase